MNVLDTFITDQERKYGKGAVIGKDTKVLLKRLPVDLVGLNDILGGGMPYGRIIEFYGPESGGKTTLSLVCQRAAVKAGLPSIFIDAEHALDSSWVEKITGAGIPSENIILSQPDYGEQALEILNDAINAGIKFAIVDSVAALVPKAELEGEMGDSHMGLQARLMSQALRKVTGTVSKHGAIVIFINQVREKIGVVYGNPETTTGGRALKFYSSIRCDVRRKEYVKKGSDIIGTRVRVKIVKNKTARPFGEMDFVITDNGPEFERNLIEVATEQGIVSKKGSWYSYGEQKIGQGLDAVCDFFKDNDSLYGEIKSKVMDGRV